MRYKVCSFAGCPELITVSTRCEGHTVIRKDDRPSAHQRGYDKKRWKPARDNYLHRNPICAIVGCGRPSTDVDHIDGQGPLGPHGFDETNFRALCHQHHSAITAATAHWNRKINSQNKSRSN